MSAAPLVGRTRRALGPAEAGKLCHRAATLPDPAAALGWGRSAEVATSNRYILDYLVEEVLRNRSKEVQTFLMKTSVLERLTASLCDEVTGQYDSQELLENLERDKLFIISLDEERAWYRYHQLFRDLLCKRAQQNYPSEIENWHRLASLWFETHGMLDEAIEHALAAEDNERAVDLIEMSAQSTILRSEFYTFQGWVSRLPEELVCNRPNLILFYAWALTLV